MILSFHAVSKTFLSLRGPVPAVRDVDLLVEDGELFVLLGPSGCGKSTVLNLAAGLERPTSGEIRFDGGIVASRERRIFVPPGKRNVAMVFQGYALYPHLNVRENIAFPLRVAGEARGEIDRAVARTASMLGIGELLKSRPSELSGGQRQRVAIARALVRRPRLFLLDEPLSNLDASLRTATRVELRRLQRSLEVTTLYVTHDQTEAMTLGDRIALLRDGSVLQVGTPRDLYENPRTPFAASFIGPYPMNLLSAASRRKAGPASSGSGRGGSPSPRTGPGGPAAGDRPGPSRPAPRTRPDFEGHRPSIPPRDRCVRGEPRPGEARIRGNRRGRPHGSHGAKRHRRKETSSASRSLLRPRAFSARKTESDRDRWPHSP